MILSRIGINSKMVICGDLRQNDLKSKSSSGFDFLCKLQDRVNMMESINADSYRQINQNSLILEDLMEQVPPEVERISRRIAKEEGIKLFQEFRDNFNKLSEGK